ncbi:unnamed protein product [Nippostrongylus brasiliensis]|uniref:G protein-coupled receptor n=1 Tax=Nippostrongylus brasiliensis TaxID=27835 RepID=A0A0N4YIQ3_NIPBR|nr:unnamed protein product [Nippostrongylus brasiliensis]
MDMIKCTDLDPEPYFYINIVRVLAVLCTLSILLALYLIIASSDQQSKLHRMNLFVLQLSLLLFNVTFSIVAIPVSYFPMTMGYAAGLMTSSPTPCYAIIVMIIISLDMANISVGGLIGYRIQMTVPPQHFMKKHVQRTSYSVCS